MIDGQDWREFRPELLSRRGEVFAWVCAGLATLGWLVLAWTARPVSPVIPVVAVLLILSALVISLGNWADRSTRIRLDRTGIRFQNGLRKVELPWQDISEVRVIPSQWGKKVHVYGERRGFSFRTLAEVRVQGELKGRFGFAQGDEILRGIILNGGLEIVEQPGEEYTYVRRR